MCGGEIIIEGNAGDYLGFFMRRGLIIIKRNVGKFCGFKMIAGTLILFQGYESFFRVVYEKRFNYFVKK